MRDNSSSLGKGRGKRAKQFHISPGRRAPGPRRLPMGKPLWCLCRDPPCRGCRLRIWVQKRSDEYKLKVASLESRLKMANKEKTIYFMCGSVILNPSHPFWPGLGALLLKVRAALALNLGGAFLSAGTATSAISMSYWKSRTKHMRSMVATALY